MGLNFPRAFNEYLVSVNIVLGTVWDALCTCDYLICLKCYAVSMISSVFE